MPPTSGYKKLFAPKNGGGFLYCLQCLFIVAFFFFLSSFGNSFDMRQCVLVRKCNTWCVIRVCVRLDTCAGEVAYQARRCSSQFSLGSEVLKET